MANNCKIFTPEEYVEELLDAVEYREHLYGQSVLENSCGDGNILMGVVRRYILSCRADGRTDEEIRRGLERDICGMELEEKHAAKCRENLQAVATQLGIEEVKWNIIEGNYLHYSFNRQFDYVLSNPPYVVYRDIEQGERDYLKEHFTCCAEGKFDYYYAFIEKSMNELTPNGKMAYIIPYSIYKNVFARKLREQIKPYVAKICDYTSQQKFPGITTSSTILVIQNTPSIRFSYTDEVTGEQIEILKERLSSKWIFIRYLEAFEEMYRAKRQPFKFGTYFDVNNTIATLYNEAFLLEGYTLNGEYYESETGDKVEAALVRPAVSKKKRKQDKLHIIFPYKWENGVLTHYEDKDFRKQFPYATAHLLQYETKLGKRAVDKSAQWFEYGRSQAITKITQEKLVMPSIISSAVNVTEEDADTIPCAGFFITAKEGHTLAEAKKILESAEFYDYLKLIGIFTTGKSRRLTVKDIANYTFDNWE